MHLNREHTLLTSLVICLSIAFVFYSQVEVFLRKLNKQLQLADMQISGSSSLSGNQNVCIQISLGQVFLEGIPGNPRSVNAIRTIRFSN